MNIAIITYGIDVGGVESVMLNLSKIFKKKNYNVIFFQVNYDGIWKNYFISQGFQVVNIIRKYYESRTSYLKRILYNLKDFDLILLNDVPEVHSILGFLNSKQIVFSILHNNIDSMIRNSILNIENINKVICVSPYLQKKLIDSFPQYDKKIIHISNGVYVNNYYIRKNFSDKIVNLLFVGRLDHDQKGVNYLPDILKNIVKYNKNVKLNIIGEGKDKNKMIKKFNDYKLMNYVNFLGKMNNAKVLEFMKDNHILLMPSHYEGHPIVLMEAMSNGIIPIVSELENITTHVVSDGKNGFICKVSDLDCFSKKVNQIINDKNLMNEISFNAWKTIFKKFSINNMANNYLKLFEFEKKHLMPKLNYLVIDNMDNMFDIPLFLEKGIKFSKRLYNKVIK
ncbi:glycosyltransferase family 4 protein [Caminibacter mediatlanticus TB-2]|uniref:Glycosyltransferase family 4 protein n=1 Tax=Caminibacter mediatlanticus TB-2 TaxID=391592 RepID=A0ABX5VBH5_9BACT|nr:glycosyltransferase family 4 protein [Caminibacter mediatlanticus]QCT93956.1 glycosyltransferase family 4 protein [Caminibacter mediatlanticus TB-2]